MALSDPRILFGVHSWTPYSRTTGEYYGTVRVLESSSLSLSGELIKLQGGSNRWPWAIEPGLLTAEMSLNVKEYPSFLFQLFQGKAPTDASADTAGSVSTPVEVTGTTIMDATTGLASIIVIPSTGAANLKFTQYVIKATDSNSLNIYAASDINFARGTDETFDSDVLLVATADIGNAGATTDVASLGLRFTAGSGTTAFTTGDTAKFKVLPPSTKSMSVVVGSTTDSFPEFGSIVYSKQRGNLEMVEVDLYRCIGVGMPLSFETNAFSQAEINVEAFYDSAQDGVYSVRHVTPSS